MDLGDYNFHLTKNREKSYQTLIEMKQTPSLLEKNGLLQSPKVHKTPNFMMKKTRPSHNCTSVSGFGLGFMISST